MNVQVLSKTSRNPSISDAEWNARLELAAAYRLMAHFGVCDLAHNHLCLRVPGEPDAFLIKHSDAFFDGDHGVDPGQVRFRRQSAAGGHAKLRGGGLIIHAGMLAARPDINATIHSHTAAIMGVASRSRACCRSISMRCISWARSPITTSAASSSTCASALLVRDLGDKKIALLRHHGSLVCGPTIGAAMVAHSTNSRLPARDNRGACRRQRGRSDRPEVRSSAEQVKTSNAGKDDGGKDWKGLLRLAERLFPDYRN